MSLRLDHFSLMHAYSEGTVATSPFSPVVAPERVGCYLLIANLTSRRCAPAKCKESPNVMESVLTSATSTINEQMAHQVVKPSKAIARSGKSKAIPVNGLKPLSKELRPNMVITFDPNHGFTGNPEHRLAGLLVDEVLNPDTGISPGRPHLVVFHILNRYTVIKALLDSDPALPTEQWPLNRSCGQQSCVKIAMQIAREHRSQLAVSALALFVLFADQFDVIYLRETPLFPAQLALFYWKIAPRGCPRIGVVARESGFESIFLIK